MADNTNIDEIRRSFEAIRDERAKHANTARRIGNAFLSLLDYASLAGNDKLSRLYDDTAQGLITFLKGIKLGADGSYGIGADGAAVLKSLVLDLLQSSDYDYATQTGFGFTKRRDGKYQLALTDLLVWGKAIFNSLEIRKLYSVGGNIILSPSASKIMRVEECYETNEGTGERVLTGWKCYLLADDGTMATTNQWMEDDQARCQTFDIAEGVYENVSNKNYWRRVTEVSDKNEVIADSGGNVLYDGKKFAWIKISAGDCMQGSDSPTEGDTIVCMGNRTNTDRQHLIILETVGDHAPSITLYRGVYGYTLTGKEIFDVSFDGVKVVSKYFKFTGSSGEKIWTPNYRGDWEEGTAYEYYDQVSHNGTMWLCIAPDGTTTTDEPSATSPYWKAMTQVIPLTLLIELNGQDTIDWGETVEVSCHVMRGDLEIDTSEGWEWSVERDSGDTTEDAAWNASAKAQSFKGSISIAFSEEENDIGDEVDGVYGTVFTFTAWRVGEKARQVSARLSV